MIISIDAENALDKSQHLLMIKIQRIGIERTYFNIVMGICDKHIANIILSSEKLKVFPLKSDIRQLCALLLLLST